MKILLILLSVVASDPQSDTHPAPVSPPTAPTAATTPSSTNAPPAATTPSSTNASPVAQQVSDAMAKLDGSKNACNERELSFDYWPHGGVRNFWCHARSTLDWSKLVAEAPVDVWTKGPHAKSKLALHDPHDFGHYNPAFVRWLVDNAVPAASDVTQPAYDKFVRELARAYYRVHVAMTPSFIKTERERYLHTMDEKKPDWASFYDRYSEFLGDADHNWGGVDPNLQSASVAFWLRRDIDGTAPLFFEGLKKLLRAYDADWLKAH